MEKLIVSLITATIVMVLVISPNAASRANASETVAMQAEKILKTTGVPGGLAVHLDCGNGELTCAMSEMASFLINALDRSQENVDALRERFSSSDGRVRVDRWNGRHLPYVDNLVNLIVIGDTRGEMRDTRYATKN